MLGHIRITTLTYETGHERRGCGNGWDDPASDELGLVPVGNGDTVVGGPQVGAGSDEVHVKVGVVILFKVGWVDFGRMRRRSLGQLGHQLFQGLIVAHGAVLVGLGLCVCNGNLDPRLGDKLWHGDLVDEGFDESPVPVGGKAVVEGPEVGRGHHVVQVEVVVGVKLDGFGAPFGPDQNKAPDDVSWSLGKLNNNCRMVLEKNSSKLSLAPATQS